MTFCWMYEKDLLASGIPAGRIYKVGFAFFGKDVLVKNKSQVSVIIDGKDVLVKENDLAH